MGDFLSGIAKTIGEVIAQNYVSGWGGCKSVGFEIRVWFCIGVGSG